MRPRSLLALVAVIAVGAAAIVGALIVRSEDQKDFKRVQREEAARSASGVEAIADISVGQLSSASAVYLAERGRLSKREFHLLAHSLLAHRPLSTTGFTVRVPGTRRTAYQRRHGFTIVDKRGQQLVPAPQRRVYYTDAYFASEINGPPGRGFDEGSRPVRLATLRQAANRKRPLATPIIPLLRGGGDGLIVYQPIYRAGADTSTVAARRAALVGFATGVFRATDLAKAAVATIPTNATIQLLSKGKVVVGPDEALDHPAIVPLHIAGRSWMLALSDPDTPSLALPIAIAIAGLLLAGFIGALLMLWSRSERLARTIADRRIGERDRAVAEQLETEKRYRLLAESATDGITVHDRDGRYVYVSPSVETLFGWTQDDLLGREAADLIHPDDLPDVRTLNSLLDRVGTSSFQARFRCKDGTYTWIESTVRSTADPDTGEVNELQIASRDISRRKQMERELERLANEDGLTGLKNRRRLEEELDGELARTRRQGSAGAVLLLDIDHFKTVNDTLGHSAGDAVIQETARVLSARMRESDVLGRLGGDEFALVLPGAGERDARVVAETIVKAIREHRFERPDVPPITASVGIALFDDDPRMTVETVIAEADMAMYAAKGDGRDRVRVYDIKRDGPTPEDTDQGAAERPPGGDEETA